MKENKKPKKPKFGKTKHKKEMVLTKRQVLQGFTEKKTKTQSHRIKFYKIGEIRKVLNKPTYWYTGEKIRITSIEKHKDMITIIKFEVIKN